MPWILAKDEEKKDRLEQVLYNLSEGIIITSSLLSPFMPDVSKKIEESFNVSLRDFDKLENFGVIDNYEVASSD